LCHQAKEHREGVTAHLAFGDRHGGRYYRLIVGPVSLPGTLNVLVLRLRLGTHAFRALPGKASYFTEAREAEPHSR
jgi:hypothetical protein